MLLSSNISAALGFQQGLVNLGSIPQNLTATQLHYTKAAVDLGISAIYFSGSHPSIYIKDVERFDEETLHAIAQTQKRIWNQGKVSLLYVQAQTEIRIYNCFEIPINPKDQNEHIDSLEVFKTDRSNKKGLQELVEIFGKVSIETGQFWKQKKYSSLLKSDKRVHPALLKNLKFVRKKLTEQGLGSDIVQDLLMRSLFMLYLEDRGATDKTFYQKFLPDANSYFDILDDLEATYGIFKKLEDSFNGNLSPVTEIEKEQVNADHLQWIKKCFWDEIEENGQTKLFDWKAFNFKFIPIELISEIYEEFLLNQSEDGAYYTPQPLVEFILQEKLPWASDKNTHNKYDIKTLDPTCGSGIFLVETFNRLVDRWKFNHPNQDLNFQILETILLENIYGIEKNAKAIKVAAFSLYLALLDKLEPKTLWQEKQFPYLIYDPENENLNTQGQNLFCLNSLDPGPFEEIPFELVVGNPPYKKGSLDAETKQQLKKLGFAQELAIAFLWRVTQIAPSADIALVVSTKVLTNTSGTYSKFRDFLFNGNYVESIFNLSILRNAPKNYGGSLFASAIGPACIIYYTHSSPENPKDYILYYAPKTYLKTSLIDGMIIDQTDVNYLPRRKHQEPDDFIWKTAMWGTKNDYSLLSRLKSIASIKSRFKNPENDWKAGRGLHKSDDGRNHVHYVETIPFISNRQIRRFHTEINLSIKLSKEKVQFRHIDSDRFKGPLILIKQGLADKSVCASYIPTDVLFRDVYSLTSKKANNALLKSLTAYFNSKLASYQIFLTSSSWGIERDRIELKEILSLPSLVLDFNEQQLKRLSECVDGIIRLKQEGVFISGAIESMEKHIDGLLYEYFGLNKKERWLIEDQINYGLDVFKEGVKSQAFNPCPVEHSGTYASVITDELNDFLSSGSKLYSWSTIYQTPANVPLNIVAIHLNNKAEKGQVTELNAAQLENKLLKEIEPYCYKKHSESIFFRRTIKYMKDDTVFIVKPNEKRFWSRSMAMNDADELILEILNS